MVAFGAAERKRERHGADALRSSPGSILNDHLVVDKSIYTYGARFSPTLIRRISGERYFNEADIHPRGLASHCSTERCDCFVSDGAMAARNAAIFHNLL